MNDFSELLEFSFFQRAIWSAAVVGFANGFLSAFVLMRRSALVVGSLSHTLLPGIAVATMLAGLSAASAFVGGLTAALLIAVGAVFLSRTSRLDSSTALLVLYTGAFAAGLLVLDSMTDEVELEGWLFGNILAVSDAELVVAWVSAAVILPALAILNRPLLIVLFEPSIAASQGIAVKPLLYLLTALVVFGLVASIQAVGCILAVATLVAPAAAVSQFANSPRILMWGGAILGSVVCVASVLVAYILNLRVGATIVLGLTAVVLLAYLFSPRYGAVRRWRRKPPEHHAE